jgi:DNA-binding IclR family transcriptional regulator
VPTRKKKAPARQGIQSIEVGSTLLEVLSRAHSALSLSELSRQADMSASKAHRYLVSLLRTGLVLQDPVTNRYDVGALSLKLGLAALNRTDLVRFGIEAATWLNRELDTTVLLCVWGNFGPTVVAMYNSSDLMIQNVNVGTVLPLTRSATGRVFLAYMPRRTTAQQVKQELKGPLTHLPISRVRTSADIEDVIKKVRKQRLGTTQGDVVPGQSALAAPVFDHEGRIVAALTLIGASDKVDMSVPNSPAQTLLRTADMVSQRLGFWHAEGGTSYVELLESRPDSLPARARRESGTLVELFAAAKRSAR